MACCPACDHGHPCTSLVQRTGQGSDGGAALDAAMAQAGMPAPAANAVMAFAAPGALSEQAADMMATLANGAVPSDTQLASVVAGAASRFGSLGNGLRPPAPPSLMAVVAPLFAAASAVVPVYGIGYSILQSVLAIAGWAQGAPPGHWCGGLNLDTDPIPWGPGDTAHWRTLPWDACVAPDGSSCGPMGSEPVSGCVGLDGEQTDAWCEWMAGIPGDTFEHFYFQALFHNWELGFNCQPNAVDDQALLLHCILEWNAAHGSTADDYTIVGDETYNQWPTHYIPVMLRILGGWENQQPAPPQVIHGGPLNLVRQAIANIVHTRPSALVNVLGGPPGHLVSAGHALAQGHATGAPDASTVVRGIELCAKAGDEGCKKRLAALQAAEVQLRKSPDFWIAYYAAPKSARATLLERRALTMSAGKAAALVAACDPELGECLHAASWPLRSD